MEIWSNGGSSEKSTQSLNRSVFPAMPNRPARGDAVNRLARVPDSFLRVSNWARVVSRSFSKLNKPVLMPPTFCAASARPGVSRNALPAPSLLRRYSSSNEISVVSAT